MNSEKSGEQIDYWNDFEYYTEVTKNQKVFKKGGYFNYNNILLNKIYITFIYHVLQTFRNIDTI